MWDLHGVIINLRAHTKSVMYEADLIRASSQGTYWIHHFRVMLSNDPYGSAFTKVRIIPTAAISLDKRSRSCLRGILQRRNLSFIVMARTWLRENIRNHMTIGKGSSDLSSILRTFFLASLVGEVIKVFFSN
ncbi:hypothetical protein VNO77_44525 [Canavalia gladiata]|uniref:Uncharacterized protein n=1 Tax=Canavalia gladiata TaxID=3824 RepID=A0AAN9PQF0_CANGL